MVTTQRERVHLLAKRLLTTETTRRQAARDGNRQLASDLANVNRDLIGEAFPGDLRSLVTVWMMALGQALDEATLPDTRWPFCGLTHDQHAARWRSWRDDCPICGYAQQDPDQCRRGHPDDGVTWCGGCGYTHPTPHETP